MANSIGHSEPSMTDPLSNTSPTKTKSVPAPIDFWDRLDEWRANQRPVLNVAAAVRVLVDRALDAEDKKTKLKKPN